MNRLPRNPTRGLQKGFTLIEVLVATFVFSIILASLFGTWRVIVQSTDQALRLTAENQRTRVAVQSMETALGAAQLFQANAALYAFVADTSSDFAALSFVATLPDSFPGSGYFQGQFLRRVTLQVERSQESGFDLMMYQKAVLAPDEANVIAPPLVLAREVSLFQLEFWDRQKNEFVPEWLRTNAIPPAVRFTLGFGAANRSARRSAELVTRVVRLPDNLVGADLQGGGGAPPPPSSR
jgi:prepilin-type N-terminal cleavage/methylation domain-containing protein